MWSSISIGQFRYQSVCNIVEMKLTPDLYEAEFQYAGFIILLLEAVALINGTRSVFAPPDTAKTDEKSDQKCTGTENEAKGSFKDNDKAASTVSSFSPPRPVLLAMALGGALWTGFAVLCLVSISLSGKSSGAWVEEEGASFEDNFRIPLFATAVFLFYWRMGALAKYKPATGLDKLIFSRRISWPVHWIACIFLDDAVLGVAAETIDALLSRKHCAILPGLCHLHEAYDHALPAKMAYWALFSVLAVGGATICLSIRFTKWTLGAFFLTFVYAQAVRPVLCRLLVDPTQNYIIQPLHQHLIRPMWSRLCNNETLRESIRYAFPPLAQSFPGRCTKSSPVFPQLGSLFGVPHTISAIVFVGFASLVRYMVSEDDEMLYQWCMNTSLPVQQAMLYLMAVWQLWRFASCLNFAPAVNLDKLVFRQRIGWILQFLVGIPWLYTWWHFTYITWRAMFMREGACGRFIEKGVHFGSFTVLGVNVNIIGVLFSFVVIGPVVAGQLHWPITILVVQMSCFERVTGRGKKPALTTASNEPKLNKKASENEEARLV